MITTRPEVEPAGLYTQKQAAEALFDEPIEWCKDLPLKGAGYSTPYYLKD